MAYTLKDYSACAQVSAAELLNGILDNAMLSSGVAALRRGVSFEPDDMQPLYDLADEAKHGDQ